MADLYASLVPVRLNDGTADANNAKVSNAAPSSGDYALEVRQIGIPAAAALADAVANPTLTQINTFLSGYNGTTWDRLRSTTANGLAVDVTRVSGTVTVDTELAAAAAQADGAANPTVPVVGGFNSIYGGSTWDRQRSVVNGQDTTGTGIPAAGILAQLDDTATGAVTENQFAPLRMSTRRALLIEGVASGTNINVNLAASAATVTVDSELPAAAALADATANPTVPGVGGFLMGYNGTTWDRVRTANTGRLQVDVITGGGSSTQYVGDAAATATPTGTMAMALANAAAPTGVSADADAVALWALRNGSLVVNLASSGTLITVGQKVMASSIPVVISSDQSTLVVDTELTAAAAQADAAANPTIVNVGAFLSGYNGTTWDRLRSSTANGLVVDVSRVQGTVTVDTEMPAAAALADAASNPTVPGVGGFLMGYNGTTWDRVRVANTGRLQVDVITGASATTPSEVPTSHTLISLYGTAAGVSAGGVSTAVVTNTPANTKHLYVRWAYVTASGQTKWQIKFGATVLHTGFNPQSNLSGWTRFDPPLDVTGDGSTALTIDVTNRESSAMDVYAALRGIVQN